MRIELQIAGDVVERSELLNGTQTIIVEGVDASAMWRFSADLSWNMGLVDYDGEGALTMSRDDGAEIYAGAARVQQRANDDNRSDAPTEADADVIVATWDIDGGAGEFASATGSGTTTVATAGNSFTARCLLDIA